MLITFEFARFVQHGKQYYRENPTVDLFKVHGYCFLVITMTTLYVIPIAIFYNLADSRTYSLELPEVIGDKKQCWDSPYGWVVYGQEAGPLISLLNPLTRAQIQLPFLFYCRSTSPNDYNNVLPWDQTDYLADCTIVKAVLFRNPSLSSDFTIMALMEDTDDNHDITLGDVICFKGKYSVVDLDGNVYHCRLAVSPNLVILILML
ncbi:hypothetical protein IFM89_013449 [Coptis chinensis]|uniref:KIB1-4 beta-propeller domain-containing protein n=1 Tax=Coptis chinensis TaxID=261450 RepID=A0A835GZ72_9MAGN|nr:hypothetical protein IFM89_013449 [Coptis chinensis]